jgi:signal transduction histidine kinase
MSLAPVQTVAGAYMGCAVRDVTERRKADEELQMHRQRLEQLVEARTRELSLAKEAAEAANVAKGHFLANISHEIRTPLNAVVGLLHLIRRAGVPPAQAARMDAVEAASAHLLRIINALLDLAKIDSGKQELDSMPIDLAALLDEVREIMGGRAELKGLTLHTWPPEPLPALLGDATLIRQCLLNYVSNAIKFTEQGQVEIRVHRVAAEPQALTLCFEVEDSGMGLDAATQARLFQPFEQADGSSTRQHGGTGLGLVLTRRMAMLMGGDAGVRSAGPGHGSVFWFTARLSINAEAGERAPQAGAGCPAARCLRASRAAGAAGGRRAGQPADCPDLAGRGRAAGHHRDQRRGSRCRGP